jgi:hypothetical protein
VVRIRVLDPTAPAEDEVAAQTFELGRSLQGVTVGLRLDRSWRSYFVVLDTWEELLVRDGATVKRLVVGERVGAEGERTRNDLDDWARLVDCAVVGLGN